MQLDQAVSLLCGVREPDASSTSRIAVMYLSACVRSGGDELASRLDVSVQAASLISQLQSSKDCDKWEASCDLLNNIKFDLLAAAYTGSEINLPNVSYGDTSDDRFIIADTVRFLLNYKPTSTDKRKAASLLKAYPVLDRLNGKSTFAPSRSDFFNKWARYKRFAPFIFVDEYVYGGRMTVDPTRQSFVVDLERLSAPSMPYTRFFGQVRSVEARLRQILFKRKGDNITFLNIPDRIRQVVVPDFVLPVEIYRVVSRQVRSRREKERDFD